MQFPFYIAKRYLFSNNFLRVFGTLLLVGLFLTALLFPWFFTAGSWLAKAIILAFQVLSFLLLPKIVKEGSLPYFLISFIFAPWCFWFSILKKHSANVNAINIISGISVLGITIGTAALVLILSVFNGFEDLLSDLFGHFNPPVKVTPAKGKTFELDSVTLAEIRSMEEVGVVSQTLEEVAFFEYGESQDFGVLKGVDEQFRNVNGIDSTVREGEYRLENEQGTFAVLGAGVRNKLSVNVDNVFEPLVIYMPVEKTSALNPKPFQTRYIYPSGTFAIQQDYDNQYVLTSLRFMRDLLKKPNALSSLEIKPADGVSTDALKKKLATVLGEGYVLKDRFEQNEAFFKVMQLEKWMGYALTALMMALLAFNMVGALWMIVLDKQRDISILKSMGASDRTVHRIFVAEGMMLTVIGLMVGYALAVGLYALQKNYGIVSVPDSFLINSYPISMRLSDFPPVTLTVLLIGWVASLPSAQRTLKIPAYFREE